MRDQIRSRTVGTDACHDDTFRFVIPDPGSIIVCTRGRLQHFQHGQGVAGSIGDIPHFSSECIFERRRFDLSSKCALPPVDTIVSSNTSIRIGIPDGISIGRALPDGKRYQSHTVAGGLRIMHGSVPVLVMIVQVVYVGLVEKRQEMQAERSSFSGW